MKLGKGITFYATEEARKKWEGRERPEKETTCGCLSCGIEAMAKKAREKDHTNNHPKEENEE